MGHHPSAGGNSQLRPGLNPMMRGYSPSKIRWKTAGVASSGTTAGRAGAGHTGSNGAATHGVSTSSHYGGSHTASGGGHFGGTNPNVYTRSTKHTPAHSSKV